jgi:ketosteroid isomerase-like protein
MKLWCTCVLLLASVLNCVSQEPVKPKLTPRIITGTRQVTLFSGLEKQLLQAVQKKDKSGLEKIVSDECQVAFPKADPLDCGDWIDTVMAKDFELKSFSVRNMSVTDLGDFALVNYDRVQQATHGGKDLSGEFFVLDVWRKNGDNWKLTNRYVSRESAAATTVASPTPSGKE